MSQKTMCQLILCSMLVKCELISIKIGTHVLQETLNRTMQKLPTSHEICTSTTGQIWSDRLNRQRSTYMCILTNHWIATKRLAVIVSNNVKRAVSHILFTLYARNVCIPHERKHVDAGATSPTARSTNSVIQTVHSFLMRHLSSSTSEILVRTGGGHFEHVL